MRRTEQSTTGIEWTDHTWNPFVGCSIVSAGCTNCYAMRLAARIESFGVDHYQGTTRKANGQAVWTGRVRLASERALAKPYTLRTPSMVFVNSMSDFFHEAARDEWRLRVIDIIAKTPEHQYQVLTKRPEEISGFLARTGVALPNNVWLGVTVEHQKTAHRIDLLRDAPAAIRFLSLEPLIAPGISKLGLTGVHWVIAGGESGPGARPMKTSWVRSIRDQCLAQRVAFFFKQWGRPENNPLWSEAPSGTAPPAWVKRHDPNGKGGSTLDGREWKEFPRGA